jgi:hypothetical protein
MNEIKIHRYDGEGGAGGFAGYVEPSDKSWILFIGNDGAPLFYPHRNPDGGVNCEGVGPHNVRASGASKHDATRPDLCPYQHLHEKPGRGCNCGHQGPPPVRRG